MKHLVAAALAVALAGPAHARNRPKPLTVPLRIRVASCPAREGAPKPCRSRAWVKKHLRTAGKIFGRHGVKLAPVIEPFTPARCVLLTRAHRHAAAAHVQMDGKITVLVMPRVRDVDVTSYNLMGVHWRYRGKEAAHRGKRWVFLTARAVPPVLAHELCHYFGLPHDRAGGNLMTPGPSDPIYSKEGADRPASFKAVLTRAQVRRLRRGVRRLLKKVGR